MVPIEDVTVGWYWAKLIDPEYTGGYYRDKPFIVEVNDYGEGLCLTSFWSRNLKHHKFIARIPEPVEDETCEQDEIEDGFGSTWSAWCSDCGNKSMSVVRPGKVQCGLCIDGEPITEARKGGGCDE